MPLEATAQSLEAISGPTRGKSGDTLTFVVEARDSDGNPQPEVAVHFGRSPSDDTSELGTYKKTTNIDGRAKITLILEQDAVGIYRITVWRDDDVGLTVTFAVTIDAAPRPRSITETTTTPLAEPPTLSIVSGNNQEGVAGTVLAAPFVVELRNENDTPLSRIVVTFTVTAGRGAMSVVTSTTDSDGQVASLMTLSGGPGINRVQVSAEGLSETVIFNAEGTTAPSEPMPDGEEEVTPPPPEPMPDEEEEITPSTPEPMPDEEEEITPSTPEPMPDEEEEITPSTPEPEPSLEFNFTVPSGFSLIHVPLRVTTVNGMPATIESVADLYDVLTDAETVGLFYTYDPPTQDWHRYVGDSSRGSIADKVLTDQTGIVAYMTAPVSVRLEGDALGMGGMSTITLTPGTNLVGLPLMDSSIVHVSDLFTIDGIMDKVVAITALDNGTFKTIDRFDAGGNIPITGGSAFILVATEAAIVPITGTGWQKR
jgi:hypothetical protein